MIQAFEIRYTYGADDIFVKVATVAAKTSQRAVLILEKYRCQSVMIMGTTAVIVEPELPKLITENMI